MAEIHILKTRAQISTQSWTLPSSADVEFLIVENLITTGAICVLSLCELVLSSLIRKELRKPHRPDQEKEFKSWERKLREELVDTIRAMIDRGEIFVLRIIAQGHIHGNASSHEFLVHSSKHIVVCPLKTELKDI